MRESIKLLHQSRPLGADCYLNGSKQPTEAGLTGANRAVDHGWLRNNGTHLPHQNQQDLGLAMERSLPNREDGRLTARQDPLLVHSPLSVELQARVTAATQAAASGETTYWMTHARPLWRNALQR